MNKVYSKFKRGDVWYVKLSTELGDGNSKSSVQKKSRPYVIVSCEENNNCAPIINAVPITTQPYDHLPIHVYFKYCDRHQLVLCEQVTTLSVLDFNRDGSHFMYSFNIEFMNKVDEALTAQLGLRPRVADMKVLENLIDKISEDKEAELKRKYETKLEARVSAIAAKLAKQFGITLTSEDMIDGVNYRPEQLEFVDKATKDMMSANISDRTTPKNNDTPSKSEDTEESKPLKKPTRTKNKWNEESMTRFLDDYNHLSISAMSSKYSMAKKSVVSYASQFRKKLNAAKE